MGLSLKDPTVYWVRQTANNQLCARAVDHRERNHTQFDLPKSRRLPWKGYNWVEPWQGNRNSLGWWSRSLDQSSWSMHGDTANVWIIRRATALKSTLSSACVLNKHSLFFLPFFGTIYIWHTQVYIVQKMYILMASPMNTPVKPTPRQGWPRPSPPKVSSWPLGTLPPMPLSPGCHSSAALCVVCTYEGEGCTPQHAWRSQRITAESQLSLLPCGLGNGALVIRLHSRQY